MEKTTVYLPRDLKRALTRLARQQGRSEAALIRDALARLTRGGTPPPPPLPLFRAAPIAGDIDRALDGFGEP